MVDQVRAIARALEKFTEQLIVKITLDLDANLREDTPVDTGWARANWVPAIGKRFDIDLSSIKPTKEIASFQAANQAASFLAFAGAYRLSLGRVFVSNNVSYIVGLNDGTIPTRKAPVAFVQRAIAKAVTVDIKGIATK